jgi:hypothetical protein
MRIRIKIAVLLSAILISGCSCTPTKQPVTSASTSANAENYFFPRGTFDPTRSDRDKFVCDWYSKHLRAMQEPSLSSGQRTADAVYRFLWLRTFDHPIAVRVEITGSVAVLHAVELDGAGGYDPGKPLRQMDRTLSAAEREKLITGLKKVWYWGTPRYMAVGGLDGAEWILEGAENGQYQIMKEWSPRMGAYHDLCLLFLEFTGFSIPPKEIY